MIPGSANPLLLATAAAGGYSISRSVRFNSSDSAYLSRTPASAGNRKTWTWSAWIKRNKLGTIQQFLTCSTSGYSTWSILGFNANDTLSVWFQAGSNPNLQSTAVYRDCSAWMHVLINCDTTQATAANRGAIYVNGVKVTTFNFETYPSQNADTDFNTTYAHDIGRQSTGAYYCDFMLADVHWIDGQALDPTSFGEFSATTGVWMPKAYSGGSYGTNGFHLDFSNNASAAALGTDVSGAGNTWTVNNLSVTAGAGNDSLVDVPTNGSEVDTGSGGQVRGNYATFNNLLNTSGSYANGNLERTQSDNFGAISTICPSSGKWYAEFTYTAIGSAGVGAIVTNLLSSSGANGLGQTWQLGSDHRGFLYNAGSSTSVTSYTTNDVIGLAFDCGTGAASFYKNGTLLGTITNSAFANVPVGIGSATGGAAGSNTVVANYGARSFAYTAPSGFKALCTANLPAPVVTKPTSVFDVKLYTGNGGTQTISGLGFSPDLVWLKARNNNFVNGLFDTVRGPSRFLVSNSTVAELVNEVDGYLSAFTSDGFTLSPGTSSSNTFNSNAGTQVAWTWDAGSSTVTNTQGSISSQVRANASAGFSIVTFTKTANTNETIGHGLNVAPSLVIVKTRESSGYTGWAVYHISTGSNGYLELNTTSGFNTLSTTWNNTAPTSSVFSMGTGWTSTQNMVAYCFAPVAGYVNAFSYTGTGGEGPMVYLGMRPRLVLIKRTDSTGSWFLFDAARSPYNETRKYLLAESSAAEGDDGDITNGWQLDFLSNGFKIRADAALQLNANGGTYVGFAWAESPFQYARAR